MALKVLRKLIISEKKYISNKLTKSDRNTLSKQGLESNEFVFVLSFKHSDNSALRVTTLHSRTRFLVRHYSGYSSSVMVWITNLVNRTSFMIPSK